MTEDNVINNYGATGIGRRKLLRIAGGITAMTIASTGAQAFAEPSIQLTDEWDKTFRKSDKVEHRKVTFKNRYGITLAADLYQPHGSSGRLAAIAISGPFGAVKEQSSGLYAQTIAERGFVTLRLTHPIPEKVAASRAM